MMRRTLTAAATVVALAGCAAPALAATGADPYAGPYPELFLGTAGAGTADNSAYGVDGGEPLTSGPLGGCPRMANTAWWKIRGNGHTLVIKTARSDMDTELAIYDAAPGAASGANLMKCHTDVNLAAGDRTSLASIPNTQRGRWYSVQVGSQNRCSDATPCYDTGSIVVDAAGSPRPANDDRAAALALPASRVASSDNTGATLEAGENATCGSTPFSATVWFSWTAPATGTAVFDTRSTFTNVTQSGNTVLAIYRGGDGARLGCNDDAAEFAGPSRVTLPVSAGDRFLLQAGAYGPDGQLTGEGTITAQVTLQENLDLDGDGIPRPTDCADGSAAIHPGAIDVPGNGIDEDCDGADAVDLDRDRDGVPRPIDCDDDDPARHQGAHDVPEDGIDQDCNGRDAHWPELRAALVFEWAHDGDATRLTKLVVRKAKKGARVVVRCRGGGCPYAKRRRVFKHDGNYSLRRPFRNRSLAPGARVRVDIGLAGWIGKRYVLRMRRGMSPATSGRCIAPGGRPTRC